MSKILRNIIFGFFICFVTLISLYFINKNYIKPYYLKETVDMDTEIQYKKLNKSYYDDSSKCNFETNLYFKNKTINFKAEIIFEENNRKLTFDEIANIVIALRNTTDNIILPNDCIEQEKIIDNLNNVIKDCINANYVISRFD